MDRVINRDEPSLFNLTYTGLARFVAFTFVLFWSLDSFIDLAKLRWLNILLMFSFVFFCGQRKGYCRYLFMTVCLFLAIIPSVILSVEPIYSLAQFLRFVSVVLFCLFVGVLAEENRLRILHDAVYCVVILTVISVILFPVLNDELIQFSSNRVRYSGVFYHANIAGFCSGVTVLFSVYLLFFREKSNFGILCGLMMLLSGVLILILSDSRSALVAVIGGVGVLAKSYFRSHFNLNLLVFMAVPLLVFSFIPLFLVMSVDSISLADSPHNASMLERFYLWNWAFSMFESSNFFGAGFGIPLFTGDITWDGELVSYPYAHNIVLNILAWSGLSGLLYLSAIYFVVLRTSIVQVQSRYSYYILPQSLVFFVFTWSLLDGALQGMWLTHLIFWLSASCLIDARDG